MKQFHFETEQDILNFENRVLPRRDSPHNTCEIKLTCKHCGLEFLAGRKGTLYCSYRCVNDSHIESRKAKATARRKNTCLICGNSIEQTNAKITLYCSPACKQKAYRQRKAETASINI